jgi:hypothetical protein
MTERSEFLEMLIALQLSDMRAAYDEIVTTAVKRQHGVEKVIVALLKAVIAAKQARSINYQMASQDRRWPKSWPTCPSKARRSTSIWSRIWPAARS